METTVNIVIRLEVRRGGERRNHITNVENC